MHLPLIIFVFATLGQSPEPATLPLKTQLESYFRTAKSTDRAIAAAVITNNHRFETVVLELSRLELWPKDQAPALPWQITLPSGNAVSPIVRVPADYDASKAIPLILSFLPKSQSKDNLIGNLMTEPKIQQVWVAIEKPVGGSFHQPTLTANDLPVLLRELRRKFHVDVDRTFVLGEDPGADAAWVAALMYPTHFSGMIAFNGYPKLPYPEQSLALLLSNLRTTPVLSIFRDDATEASPLVAVNRAISAFAQAAGLPIEMVAIAPANSHGLELSISRMRETLKNKRQPQSNVNLWFRYLPQGNAGWLRATDLAGDVWDDEQISIAVTAKEDRDEFITETIKQKLFYISGRIDGQTITIDTKRVGGVELRLSPEQVDFSKPVSIFINGRNRFEGALEPSIKDLLESAYEDWDFQHPAHYRKTFSINAK